MSEKVSSELISSSVYLETNLFILPSQSFIVPKSRPRRVQARSATRRKLLLKAS